MSESELKKIIIMGGGEWLGIDYTPSKLRQPRENLVLFNHPKNHSTHALPISQISIENVKRKLMANLKIKMRELVE